MSNLSITRTYQNSTTVSLSSADLDNIRTSITTFINTTKLSNGNINVSSIASGLSSSGVASILATAGVGTFTRGTSFISGINTGGLANDVTIVGTELVIPATGTYMIWACGHASASNGSTSGAFSRTFYIKGPSIRSAPYTVGGTNPAGGGGVFASPFNLIAIAACTAADSVSLYTGSNLAAATVFGQLFAMRVK